MSLLLSSNAFDHECSFNYSRNKSSYATYKTGSESIQEVSFYALMTLYSNIYIYSKSQRIIYKYDLQPEHVDE